MNKYCVFSTGDDRYIPKAVVSLLSFKKYNPNYDMFVLCSDLSKENKRLCDDCGVSVIEIDLGGIFYQTWKYPKECYYHFKGPELFLPKGYDYSVYIDGDTYCHSKFEFDISEIFHVAGTSYDTHKELFTEIGEYDRVRHNLEITSEDDFNKRRIQSGVLVYNNKKLNEIDYFKKVGELYDCSIKRDVPRKGDDSLLSLTLAMYPEIQTKELSKYHNLIDFKVEAMKKNGSDIDNDIFAHCVIYHFIEQKPWFSIDQYLGYAHKVFVRKWLEVMMNHFTQRNIKRCFPNEYKEEVDSSCCQSSGPDLGK